MLALIGTLNCSILQPRIFYLFHSLAVGTEEEITVLNCNKGNCGCILGRTSKLGEWLKIGIATEEVVESLPL